VGSGYLFGNFLQLPAFRSSVSVGAPQVGLVHTRFLSWRCKVLNAEPFFAAKLVLSQFAGFEFGHQSFDLFTASSLMPGSPRMDCGKCGEAGSLDHVKRTQTLCTSDQRTFGTLILGAKGPRVPKDPPSKGFWLNPPLVL
jgi:hypothetical protein